MSNLSDFMRGVGSAGGAPQYYEEITVSKTWTKPAGITTFFVEVFGGSEADAFAKEVARLYQSSELPSSVVVTIGAAVINNTSSFGSLTSSSGVSKSGGVSKSDYAWGVQTGGNFNHRTSSITNPGFVRIIGW